MLARTFRVIAGSGFLLAAAGISAGAQGPWNAVSGFGSTNPSAPWSYGASATLGGAFQQSNTYTANCDPSEPGTNGTLSCWGDGRADAGANGENEVIKNSTDSTVNYAGNGVHQPSNMLALNIARDTGFTILRFTAPNSGTYNVTGLFENLSDFGGTDPVFVLENSDAVNPIFTGSINEHDAANGDSAPFSFSSFLSAGTTLDFIGEHSANGLPGSAGIQADITENSLTTTPEPSSMALLGSGLVGLVPLLRRRRTLK